jgi:regulatory protein
LKITAIRAHRRDRQRVDLYVDGERCCTAPLEAVHRLGIGPGDDVTAATLAALEDEDEVWRGRETAYRLLARRARSVQELRRSLMRRHFAAGVIDGILAELADRGYLDDAAFSAAFVRDRLRLRPSGRARLVQELRVRGVDAALAGEAVRAVFASAGATEAQLALQAAGAWSRRHPVHGRGDDVARRRRLYAHLVRRGFDADAIGGALRRFAS